MLDLNGIQDGNMEVSVFSSATGTYDFHVWTKPRGCKIVYFFMVSPGGGGGGGATGTGTNRNGGGGGASGMTLRAMAPALALPDVLYVDVPNGASGGAAGVAGTVCPRMAIYANYGPLNINNYLFRFPANTVNSGGRETGAGGTAVSSLSDSPFSALCNFVSTNGVAGSAGGAGTGANGASQTALNGICLTGGAGGGGTPAAGTDFSGGSITGAGALSTNPGGTAGGGAGSGGTFVRKPFCATGGSGGGTNGAAGVGGAGGNGAYGCGGGGGGGGVTGGRGGNGGDGLCIIISIF